MKDRVVINRSQRKSIQNNHIQNTTENKQHKNQQRNMSQSYFEIIKREKDVYKKRQEQVQTKCQLLQRIIQENGLAEQIPNTFIQELSVTSKRIREIQELITDKNHSTMKILQKQILIFLKDIGFEVPDKVFQKIGTEVQMINFILQLFAHRYEELIEEKQVLERFIKSFRQSQQANEKYYQQQTLQFKMEIEELLKRYRQQEQEIYELTRQLEQRAQYQQTELRDSINLIENNCQQLEKQNTQLRAEINQANQSVVHKQLQIRQIRAVAEDLQAELQDALIKIEVLQNDLAKMQRQQVRSKQRSEIVLSQKNQRIKVLEKMVSQAQTPNNLVTQSEYDGENYHNERSDQYYTNRDAQIN